MAVTILAAAIPAVGAARHSIVGHKQEAARSTRRPLWQRLYLDLFALMVAVYGYYLLTQRKSIVTTGADQRLVVEPLQLIVPAMFVFAMALLLLRVLPLIAGGLAEVAGYLGGPSALLALRQVSRTPRQYMALVLLLAVTLALGAYSASTAHTIGRNLAERTLYDTPADLDITENWPEGVPSIGGGSGGGTAYEEPLFEDNFVPGVVSASRFRAFKVTPGFTRSKESRLLGIDRLSFPDTAWWRPDFADKPLGALMNALGAGDAAAIVDRPFLQEHQLRAGDRFTLDLGAASIAFYVAEAVDYFPMLHPESGHFFVANLDYINDEIGLQPYRVLLKLDPGARAADVLDAIRQRQIRVGDIRDSRVTMTQGRTNPQRTGLFGMLTIGFVVAASLTALGFFLYAFLSFEKRLLQMGILRAIGLSVRQLFGLLIFEQVFLIAMGIIFGTAVGMAAAKLFIPFLQVSSDAQGKTPPFVVETAWLDLGRIYSVLGLMLVLELISTIWLIRRMKLYQTVKLGEES